MPTGPMVKIIVNVLGYTFIIVYVLYTEMCTISFRICVNVFVWHVSTLQTKLAALWHVVTERYSVNFHYNKL
jgi:hypothetical protein